MPETAHEQIAGFLSDRRQAAMNEHDAAERELESAKNRLATAEEYLRSVDEAIQHAASRVE
jgi:hypothetical protein